MTPLDRVSDRVSDRVYHHVSARVCDRISVRVFDSVYWRVSVRVYDRVYRRVYARVYARVADRVESATLGFRCPSCGCAYFRTDVEHRAGRAARVGQCKGCDFRWPRSIAGDRQVGLFPDREPTWSERTEYALAFGASLAQTLSSMASWSPPRK